MLALPDPEAKEAQAEQKEPQKEQKEPQKEHEPPKETQKEAKKESQKNAAPKSPTTKDKQASTQLDFSMPSSLFNAPVGGGANAVMRPDGITRSGENDDFGRDVVRALRKTMPAHEKIFGRLTVRILLSPERRRDGNPAAEGLRQLVPGPDRDVLGPAGRLPLSAQGVDLHRPHVRGHLHLQLTRASGSRILALRVPG